MAKMLWCGLDLSSDSSQWQMSSSIMGLCRFCSSWLWVAVAAVRDKRASLTDGQQMHIGTRRQIESCRILRTELTTNEACGSYFLIDS